MNSLHNYNYQESHYEVRIDNIQPQFVYFIVAICRNTWKSFYVNEKAITSIKDIH